jgi:uncharacterized protein YjbI with pentapeptide repeats
VGRLSIKIRDAKARAEVEDSFRKTIGQLLGGAAVLFGGGFAYLQFVQQQQSSHDLLISNQVSKGFEQLGSDKVVVRLGGIYALEGVMNTSEQYRRSVLEALCAFVRNGTKDGSDRSPATDIQAALIVIGRRRPGGAGVVDLTGAHLAKADLRKVNMSRADMIGADLSGADLSDADLSDANMTNDLMRNSNLTGADLKRGWLGGADLSGAKLSIAKLDGANMGDADLHHADLGVAHVNRASLLRAKLIGAKLIAADLLDSDLTGADLSDADLRGAVISQPQLDKACGTGAKLDPGLILKPCASPK